MEIGSISRFGSVRYYIEGHKWYICDVGELAAKEDATDSVSLLISEAQHSLLRFSPLLDRRTSSSAFHFM